MSLSKRKGNWAQESMAPVALISELRREYHVTCSLFLPGQSAADSLTTIKRHSRLLREQVHQRPK
jgi:hypothetical protein